MLRFLALATLAGLWAGARADADSPPPAPSREFSFTYQATVTGLKPGQKARIWLPIPPSNEDQSVSLVAKDLPAEARTGREPKYGNDVLYLEAQAGRDGKIPVAVTYHVRRHEVRREAAKGEAEGDATDKLFLRPDLRVPVGGKCLVLLRGKALPREQLRIGRFLYDLVDQHMRYSKDGSGWGRGDAEWACGSGFGNCSDFHSLFISLARSQRIPAKFVMGFELPESRGAGEIAGYHCWAFFKPQGHGWIPVDISEANKHPGMKEYYFGNLTPDRVAFSVGRDLTLTPPQDGPPLNFFVYPYVEVAGKPYPDDRVERRFTYQDVGRGLAPKGVR